MSQCINIGLLKCFVIHAKSNNVDRLYYALNVYVAYKLHIQHCNQISKFIELYDTNKHKQTKTEITTVFLFISSIATPIDFAVEYSEKTPWWYRLFGRLPNVRIIFEHTCYQQYVIWHTLSWIFFFFFGFFPTESGEDFQKWDTKVRLLFLGTYLYSFSSFVSWDTKCLREWDVVWELKLLYCLC